jgi:hypothetical protein
MEGEVKKKLEQSTPRVYPVLERNLSENDVKNIENKMDPRK